MKVIYAEVFWHIAFDYWDLDLLFWCRIDRISNNGAVSIQKL